MARAGSRLVGLYRDRRWDYTDSDRRDGYSLALFGPHGHRFQHPPPAVIEDALRMPGVSSVQITFYEDVRQKRIRCRPADFA